MLDGTIRNNILCGSRVKIVEKQNQKNGKLTEGIVKQILTSEATHPYGIKVLLENGAIGRVKEIIESSNTTISNDQSTRLPPNLPINEDQNAEFKATFRFDLKRYQHTGVRACNKDVEKSISKTVAAFMNSKGGILYIGVDDDGKVLGLEEDYKTLDRPNSDKFRLIMKSSLESYLKNKIIFDYIHLDLPVIDGKEICMIKISPTPTPIFVRDGDKQECYVRVDNESKPYSYDEFIEYWQRHAAKK